MTNVDKQPLLLVPGVLCDRLLWAAQIEALSPYADISVPDHTRHNSMSGIAKDILAQAPPRFSIAGLSMGGFIIFELWRQAPDRIQRIALLNTNARPADPEFELPICEQLLEQARAEGVTAVAETLIPHFLSPPCQDNEAMRQIVFAMAEATGVENMRNQMQACMKRPNSCPDLPRVSAPTLIISGLDDPLTPPEQHEEMAELLPNASFEIIDDCGHLSTLEQPDAVNALLQDWLRATGATPTD